MDDLLVAAVSLCPLVMGRTIQEPRVSPVIPRVNLSNTILLVKMFCSMSHHNSCAQICLVKKNIIDCVSLRGWA
jgi:hypothetical protein